MSDWIGISVDDIHIGIMVGGPYHLTLDTEALHKLVEINNPEQTHNIIKFALDHQDEFESLYEIQYFKNKREHGDKYIEDHLSESIEFLRIHLTRIIEGGIASDRIKKYSSDLLDVLEKEEVKAQRYKNLRQDIIVRREEIRGKLRERGEDACQQCGSKEDLCIDHIKPLSKGGDNNMDNLQFLCRSCNSSKSNKYREKNTGKSINTGKGSRLTTRKW